MFKLKRIDSYVFSHFIKLFLMTFLICIFILLMQFLWRHVNDLVGKGVGWDILFEFFLYAVLSLVPLALPLALLLASLMTFGNLGEKFELTAMKSAGISLFRIMRPLIIFIVMICIGGFLFSNYVLPITQSKLWALVFSLRQKSPEFDIPVGEFYSGIYGVNIYVRDKEKGILKDLMIYDFSAGFENATVMVADSGKVKFSEDKKYLILSLFNGESFENLKKQRISNSSSSVPYRREEFSSKEILIDFDSEFTRFDESLMVDQHVSKNIHALSNSIDSVSRIADLRYQEQANEIITRHYLGREQNPIVLQNDTQKLPEKTLNADQLFRSLTKTEMENATLVAIENAKMKSDFIEYNLVMLSEPIRYVRRHQIEWHRKFTLSFACLIFFFIGAPLGAIIKKGGLGMPIVISVLLFIVYYIIDNTGYKMAREGFLEAYIGIWLSSIILLPVGMFLSYKASIDSAIFNIEKYKAVFRQTVKNSIQLYSKIQNKTYTDKKLPY